MNNPPEAFSLSLRQRLLPIILVIAGIGLLLVGLVMASEDASLRSRLMVAGVGLVILVIGVGMNIPAAAQKVVQFADGRISTPDTRPALTEILLLGIWFGLLTGLGEAAFQVVKDLVVQTINVPNITSVDVIWMAPLADAVVFVVIGLLLVIVAWSWPELVSFSVVTFVFALLAFRMMLQLIPGLNDLAEIVLAAGIAVQMARLMKSRSSRLYGLVWRSGSWLSLFRRRPARQSASSNPARANENPLPSRREFLVSTGVTAAGLTLGVTGAKALNEQIKVSQLPPAASGMPNVLLIVLDTVRSHNLSVYGYDRPTTPSLEAFAERSVRFKRAITSAPWTLPSHATMFTGRWHHELSLGWNQPMDNAYPTLAEVLSRQGYLTGGFVANLDFCTAQFGLNRGFLHFEDWPVSLGQTILSTSLGRDISNRGSVREAVGYYDLLNRKNAGEITNDFLRWMPDQSDRPFFAFLNYYDAHQLYLPPEPYDTMFGPRRTRNKFVYYTHAAEIESPWTMSPEEVQAELDAYDGAIAYTDAQLGRLFGELERRGVLDNTLVIVTGDHGEQFGEHDLFGHTNSLYIQTLQVPLLMSLPSRLPSGIEVPESVSLRDFPATILDVLGVEPDVQFPGASLARFWQPTPANTEAASDVLLSEIHSGLGGQEWYPIVKGLMRSAVFEQYHYIREADGQEELYDLDNDPFEENDLAGLEDYSEILAELRASMDALTAPA